MGIGSFLKTEDVVAEDLVEFRITLSVNEFEFEAYW